MSVISGSDQDGPPKVAFFNDPRVRSIAIQAILIVVVVFLVWQIVQNTIANLARANIASGFGFLETTAGFDISQTLIQYSETSTYGDAIMVGLLNTLMVAFFGIIAATIIGFVAGVMRLSKNWLVSKVAEVYIEIIRNVPLLIQMFIWYIVVLGALPNPRNAPELGIPYPSAGLIIMLPVLVGGFWLLNRLFHTFQHAIARLALTVGFIAAVVAGWAAITELGWQVVKFVPMGIFLSNRGIVVPSPIWGEGAWMIAVAFVAAIVGAFLVRRWAKKRQAETGQQFPVFLTAIAMILGVPLLAYFIIGAPVSLDYPELSGFNFRGGANLVIEFWALFLSLAVYTGAFIAEIVRAGILAVSKGQTEASSALGLRPNPTLRLVVVPQAMRVIIPPLASQYLNLTKNSSLAVAIGFPDLVSTGGTVLNQTGQAIEVIGIWMAVYLTTSLLTSAFMNWFNSTMKLVER